MAMPWADKAPHDLKQTIGLGLGERRSWFIHENYFRFAHQGARDGHNLPLGYGKRVEPCIDIKFGTKPGQDVECGFSHRCMANNARYPAQHGLDGDVFGNGHFIEKRKVLPDNNNACQARQRGRHRLHELSGHFKLAALRRPVDAGDDLDQGALATAILAGDALHFAGQYFETDILQRLYAAEGHTDIAERKHRRRVLQHGCGNAHRRGLLVILKLSQKIGKR